MIVFLLFFITFRLFKTARFGWSKYSDSQKACFHKIRFRGWKRLENGIVTVLCVSSVVSRDKIPSMVGHLNHMFFFFIQWEIHCIIKTMNETHPYIKFHPKSILMVFASNTEFKYLPLCNNMLLRQCIATVKLPSIIWEIPVLLLKGAKTQTIILKESSKRVNFFCWIIISPKWCSHDQFDQVIVITTWNSIDCIHFTVKILFIRMA